MPSPIISDKRLHKHLTGYVSLTTYAVIAVALALAFESTLLTAPYLISTVLCRRHGPISKYRAIAQDPLRNRQLTWRCTASRINSDQAGMTRKPYSLCFCNVGDE